MFVGRGFSHDKNCALITGLQPLALLRETLAPRRLCVIFSPRVAMLNFCYMPEVLKPSLQSIAFLCVRA